MPVTVKRTDFSDFEALQHIVTDQRSEIVQLGPGKMSGTLARLSFGSHFDIKTGSFSRGVRFRGVPSQHRWMFGMVLASNGTVSSLQRTVKAGDVVMVAPGQERYSSYQTSASFSLTFVEPQELVAFLESQPEALDRLKHRAMVLPSDPATAAANIEQMTMVSAMLIERGRTLSDDAVDFYKRGILDLLTAPLVRGAATRYDGQHLRAATLVRNVDQYLVDAGSRPVHVSELCEQFKVQRRTLHRAFADVLGVPPITFARRKRLGDVHTALLRGGPASIVAAIAREHGFAELGRFAGEYRKLFGEKPSQTLRRARRRSE